MNEHEHAKDLAGSILENPGIDPDDDIAVLARQLLRADEKLFDRENHWMAVSASLSGHAVDVLNSRRLLVKAHEFVEHKVKCVYRIDYAKGHEPPRACDCGLDEWFIETREALP